MVVTLPASPPITMGQIYAEFSAPSGTPLGSFLRGGAYVPNTAQNAGVPTALPISMGDLLGAAAYTPMTVTVSDLSQSTSAATNDFTTSSRSGTITGGNPSKTYSWTYVSGSSFIINSPTGSSTTFTQSGHPPAGTYVGTYRLTVNDGTGTAHDDFTVTITRT